MRPARVTLAIAASCVALGGLVLVAFSAGRFPIAAGDLAAVLWSGLTGAEHGLDPTIETVVLKIRGPRVAAALLIGAALASMHNSLSDQPSVLALCFEAALAAGITAPSLRARKIRPKTSREEKLKKRERRRQQQCLGIEDIQPQRDPILPGHGPRESARPI